MELNQSIEIMKALSDYSRLMLVNSLFSKSQYVEELAERHNLAASTVSFHLKKLEKAGIVTKEKQQYYWVYTVNGEILSLKLQQLVHFDNLEEQIQEERINEYKENIIRNFFRDGRLLKMPAQKKKRWIVLEVILKDFKAGRIYTEKEVNDMIAAYYDDYCSIRRYYIEEGVMSRENNQYCLTDSYLENSKPPRNTLRSSFQESIDSKFKVSAKKKNEKN